MAEPEPSGATVRNKEGKTEEKRKNRKRSLDDGANSDSRSSAGPSSSKNRSKRDSKTPRDESKQRKKSDDKLDEPVFLDPQEIFFVTGKSPTPSSTASTKTTKSRSRSSRTSEKSFQSGGHSRPGTSGKSTKDRRSELRPSTGGGCSGKCSQLSSKTNSRELEKPESIKRLSNKCQRPSRVKIEFCELASRRKERKPSEGNFNDDEVNKFARITEEVLGKIKKNCTKLKSDVLPDLKNKSKKALRKIKKGCASLSQSTFFKVQQNCDLRDCGSGVSDCTSRASIPSSRKSSAGINSTSGEPGGSEERRKNKSLKSSKSKNPSGCDKFQICECKDNPKKVLNDNFYPICCCTEEDSSGNKIKKGCC